LTALALAECAEIRRVERNLADREPVRAGKIEAMFFNMFPNAKSVRDLSEAQRRAWLNALRTHQRATNRFPQGVQASLPFTGGVNESQNSE